MAAEAGAGYVNTEPWFCPAAGRADLVQGMVVHRDTNHITATYATWLTPMIQADLAVATGLAIVPPGDAAVPQPSH